MLRSSVPAFGALACAAGALPRPAGGPAAFPGPAAGGRLVAPPGVSGAAAPGGFCPGGGSFGPKNLLQTMMATIASTEARSIRHCGENSLFWGSLTRESLFRQAPGRSRRAQTDGSGEGASAPATRPARRRGPRSLHTRTASRKDRNGKSPSSAAKETPGRNEARAMPRGCPHHAGSAPSRKARGSPALRLCCRLEQAQQLGRQHRKLRAGHRTPRVNDDVPSRRYLRKILPQDSADAPLDAIAHHRAAHRLFHADSQAAVPEAVGPREGRELRARAPPPAAIYRFELRAP